MKKKSSEKCSSLRGLINIGPAIEGKLKKIGITTKEQFLKKDPFKVFDKLLKKADPTLCRCALASIVGAKIGVPWYKITKQTASDYEKIHPRHRWGKC
ncbi:MAG: TfoX/Sxy family DNA transformation protein [Candidatus Margulisiibacteriota bacterium]